MGRPREFDEPTVLDALRDVFWEKGYDGASYPDIIAATGLKKGSLYAAFGDKQALYQLALARYDTQELSGAVAMLGDASIPPLARIEALFDALIADAGTKKGRWGCLLCNAAIDQAPTDKAVEKTIKASMDRLRKAIVRVADGTKADGKAELIWTLYFGGRVMIKAGYSKDVLRAVKAQAINAITK